MEVVFVPSDTFQMAPSSVDRIGIALIASNLNYRREAPRANRLFLRGYSPRLNLRLREEEEDVENIQNRKAISVHSGTAESSTLRFLPAAKPAGQWIMIHLLLLLLLSFRP